MTPSTVKPHALRRSHARRGFTLVEVLLVIVIIGIIAAFAVPNLLGTGEQARVDTAAAKIDQLKQVIDRYAITMGSLPEADGKPDDETGGSLRFLVSKEGAADQHELDENQMKKYTPGGFATIEFITDPWGNQYVFENPGSINDGGYDLRSAGPDGELGTGDDIGNWSSDADS